MFKASLTGNLNGVPGRPPAVGRIGAQGRPLGLRSDALERRICFQDGAIIGSTSNNPCEYLGQFMLSEGIITEQQLKDALELQSKTKVMMSPRDQALMSIKVEDILMEGLRRDDTSKRIRQLLPINRAIARAGAGTLVRILGGVVGAGHARRPDPARFPGTRGMRAAAARPRIGQGVRHAECRHAVFAQGGIDEDRDLAAVGGIGERLRVDHPGREHDLAGGGLGSAEGQAGEHRAVLEGQPSTRRLALCHFAAPFRSPPDPSCGSAVARSQWLSWDDCRAIAHVGPRPRQC